MRTMGEASNVPIEPPSQTRLLDAVCNLPGVIGAGVPGGKFRNIQLIAPCLSFFLSIHIQSLINFVYLLHSAGGYDAIWVLVLSPSLPSPTDQSTTTTERKIEAPEEAVVKLLNSWTEMSVRPLSRNAWAIGGDDEGERGLLREVMEEVESNKVDLIKRIKNEKGEIEWEIKELNESK